MPKKKPIVKRINKLFDEIEQEDPNAKQKVRAPKRAPVDSPSAVKDATPTVRRVYTPEPIKTVVTQTDNALALAFRTSPKNWSTLQVLDETGERKWNDDDQALIQQVTDQLSLALENARLFQETQSRAEDLAVLNELGRELTTLFDVEKIAEVVYRYTSRLMDTTNLFISLYDEATEQIRPIFVINDQERVEVPPRKLGNGLSDHILRTHEPLFIPENVPGHMQKIGIDFVALGTGRSALSWLGVPLLLGNSVKGVVGVQSVETPNLYTEQDRDLLIAVAGRAAVAIENARLFQEAQSRAEDLSVLNEMGNELSTKLDPKAIAEVVYKYTSRLMDTKNFYVALYDENKNEKAYPLVYENGEQLELGNTKVTGTGFTDYIIRNKKTVFAPSDVLGHMKTLGIEFVTLSDDDKPSQSWLGVPMMIGSRVAGVIAVQSVDTPNMYSNDDREILNTIAGQAAIAVENARLFQEAQLRAQEMSALAEVGREVSASLDVKIVLEKIAEYSMILLNSVTSAVYIPDPEFKTLIPFAVVGAEAEEIMRDHLQIGKGILGNIAKNKVGEIVNDVYKDSRAITIQGTTADVPDEHLMAVPIKLQENVTGLMAVWRVGKGIEYTETEFSFLSNLAQQAAIAIENARLFQDAQRRANEMAILNDLSRTTSEVLDLQLILNLTYEKLKGLIKIDAYLIALYDERTNTVSLPIIIDEGIHYEEEGTSSPYNPDSSTGKVIKTGEPIIDMLTPEEYSAETEIQGAVGNTNKLSASLVYVPLKLGSKVIGTLSVQSYEFDAYTQADIALVTNVANQIAVSIQNTLLFQQSRRTAAMLQAVAGVTGEIGSLLEIQPLLETIVRLTQQRFNLYHAHIFMLEPDLHSLSVKACGWKAGDEHEGTHEKRTIDLDAPVSIVARAARSRKPVFDNDVTEDSNWLPNPLLPLARSEAAIPIFSGDKLVGVLNIHSETVNHFDPNDIAIFTTLTAQISDALENAQLFQDVTNSQNQLSEALKIASIGYFEIDLGTQAITFTDELFDLLDTSAKQEGGYTHPLQQSLQKFVVPEDIPLATNAVQQAIASDGSRSDINSEVRYRTTEGRIIWVSSTYKVERDNTGRPVKVAGSSQDINARKINELTQAAITHISESALTSKTIDELLQSVHDSIQAFLPARNFYVALYDRSTNLISFPYHSDEQDNGWEPRKLGRGLTSYVIRTGKSLRITPEIYSDLEASGEIISDGVTSVDWLGVPLRSKQVVTGVIAVQTYDLSVRITERDKDALSAIAPQVSSAIERFFAEREIQKFKLGIDRSDNAVFITDTNGVIDYANPAFEKVYGFTPEETIGNTPRIIKSGITTTDQYKYFWNTLLSGGTISGEIINKTKDGRIVPVSGTNSPILDETGKIIGFLAVHQDITDRKRSEELVQRRNTYLAASAEIGRLVTSTLDLNTIFTRTVNLVSDRLGFYFAAIYQMDEDGFHAIMREATGGAGESMKIQKHRVATGLQTIIGKAVESGEFMLANDIQNEPLYQPNPLLLDTLSEVAIPLKVGGKVLGVIDIQSTQAQAFTKDDLSVLQSLADQVAVAINNATLYDESQELIKTLKEVDQLKSQFLANMSHELRTPLNSIIGFSRVILKGIDGAVTDMQQQDLTAIYNSGQHLLGLINDILDVARIEAGKMELNFEEVHLSEMIHSVFSTAKGLVKEKPIKLVEKVPANMPTIRGDTMRVRQVLLNLISNASKFTDEGSITIETQVQKSSSGKLEALINVIDTGPGISPEGQERLFKAFSQVDGSATRKSGGSGLGLSICANLVQLHGGKIGVSSEEGKGSIFWFTMPLFKQQEEEIPADRKVVLAIDDDPQVISLYERYLNPMGYHVVPLTDPAKAKERILELKPFAVTLDIMMPNIDGWTVLGTIKSDPATRDTPIIICSIVEQSDKGFNLGASDYLVKPIMEEELVHALDKLNKRGIINEVLVIDDDPNDLRLIEKILNEHGKYKAVLAEGGRRGWEIINTKQPDAIILDVFMPDMDGFMLLEKLREDPSLREIPVLVVSGGGLTNEQQKQLAEYGQRLIAKSSLKENDLIASIESALKQIDG